MITTETKLGIGLVGLAHIGRALALAFMPSPGGPERELRGHEGHDHGHEGHDHGPGGHGGPGRCPSCGRTHGPAGCPHCAKKAAAAKAARG